GRRAPQVRARSPRRDRLKRRSRARAFHGDRGQQGRHRWLRSLRKVLTCSSPCGCPRHEPCELTTVEGDFVWIHAYKREVFLLRSPASGVDRSFPDTTSP